jgi:hypothetical protein
MIWGLGKKPTDKSVTREAKKKFLEKAAWQFASPVGTPAVIDMPDLIAYSQHTLEMLLINIRLKV